MDYYKFLGVLEIVKGSIKILPKNGKLIVLIATLGILIHSSSYLLKTFFFNPLVSNMSVKAINLSSKNLSDSESTNLLHGIKKDASILVGAELAYLLAYTLIAIFINASIIYVSAMSFHGHDLSLKDLLLRVRRSFKRVFITSFHITLRAIGWIILFSMVLVTPTFLIFSKHPYVLQYLFIAFSALIFIFLLHESVVWVLAFVISVMEENCYGIEALKKAKELVKGRRVDGFVLNFVFNLFIVIISKVNAIITMKWPLEEIVVGLFVTCISYLVIMFLFMAYTLLYFKCKKNHGEEIELGGKLEYSKVPTTPFLDEVARPHHPSVTMGHHHLSPPPTTIV